MAEQGQRTEKPTKRRLEKARREGQFPASRELSAALQFLTFVALVGVIAPGILDRTRQMAGHFLTAGFNAELTTRTVTRMFWQAVGHVFLPMLWLGGALAAMALAGQLAVTRFGISVHKLMPDPTRLNPLQKLRTLPRQNAASLVQAILFLPLIAFTVWKIASANFQAYAGLAGQGLATALGVLTRSLNDFLWKAALLFLGIGCLDFMRVRRQHMQSLRMSKQEIREEVKETEGNPQMKARVRRIQRDLARRNMMKEIPRATAVIVNPTHYSIAIHYDMDAMAAPKVLAKGKNYLALRIRQIATEHQVPVIENQPLAQALYKSAEVGQEIPPHLYRAVAEVLAYIFRLMQPRRK